VAHCLHLENDGRPCRFEAEEGTSFCRWHSRKSAAPLWPGLDLRRLVLRLAALVLLLVFLVPLGVQGYRLLKSLLN
jgi:hypothetical protein